MKVGIPTEIVPGEHRVAATPESIIKLRERRLDVLVQKGAGLGSKLRDEDYAAAGAQLVEGARDLYAQSDVVLKVQGPTPQEADLFKEGSVLVSFLWALQHPEMVDKLAARRVSALAMDRVPRITRAQKMDALSAMSNIAGYKAVLMAADTYGRFFPMLMTAAGMVTPARVLVLGAGVAGLMAIATARRLGAVVEAFDVRAAAKEQVESLGAKFVDVPQMEDAEDASGYAKAQSDEQLARQRTVLGERAAESDVIITTALIPNKKAPVLITRDMLANMKHGSVIVDLATESGGNCEGSERDQVVEVDGVTVIGYSNLPSHLAPQSSLLYGRTLLSMVQHLVDKEGNLVLDHEEEITKACLVTHQGQVLVGKVLV